MVLKTNGVRRGLLQASSRDDHEPLRAALYEAANIILTKPLKGCTALKSWAMKLARRSGMKKAKVAPARRCRTHRGK